MHPAITPIISRAEKIAPKIFKMLLSWYFKPVRLQAGLSIGAYQTTPVLFAAPGNPCTVAGIKLLVVNHLPISATLRDLKGDLRFNQRYLCRVNEPVNRSLAGGSSSEHSFSVDIPREAMEQVKEFSGQLSLLGAADFSSLYGEFSVTLSLNMWVQVNR